MSEWISIKDKLPDDGEHVIGYALAEYSPNWYVGMLRYTKNLIKCPFWDECCNSQPINVTHWMPLPEPPHD